MDELRDTQYNLPIGTDCISRRKLLDKFEPWLEVHDYNDGERNVIKAVLYEIKCMPPATDTNAGTKHGMNLAEVGTDCISRAAAQTELQLSARRYTVAHEAHGEGRVVWSEDLISVSDAMDTLRKIPSKQAKKGKWIYCEDSMADCVDGYRCDQCGFFVPWDYQHKGIDYIQDYNFCPNCGADMRGEKDG